MRIVELFSCAGGMAEGFRRAGLTVTWAFDRNPDACASYAHNLGHTPIQMDVRALRRMVDTGWSPGIIDFVVADPPCQPWSRAGKHGGLDDERDCLRVTRDLILAWRPRAYLLGNVPGLDDVTVRVLLEPLSDAGYCVADHRQLNAADYGVPQKRIRPFWFGHRGGSCLTWPAPTHRNPTKLKTGHLFDALQPWQTVREALAVLPHAEWGTPAKLKLYHDRHPPSRADQPSHTITAKPRSNGGSVLEWPWDQLDTASGPNAIRLSERASAILQGFPLSWKFCGRSKARRWKQIGQAMPPPLAAAVAAVIRDWFERQPGANPTVTDKESVPCHR